MPSICSTHILRVLLLLPCLLALEKVPTFIDPTISSFNNLAVDSRTDRVYIGADKKIYQLSSKLEVEQSVVTSSITNNVNKALLIDYTANRLVICGSAQGFCSVRNLKNISEVREVQEPVVPSSAESSTVAFIAKGPAEKQVLYVGTTHKPNPQDFVLPAVSSRSLEDGHLFNLAQDRTKVFVNSLSRDRYPINYVYGFSSEGFSYLLTTQLKEVGSDIYYSKLVRVCQDDENYNSYTEIPITCTGEGVDYNVVQAAVLGKANPKLAKNLGINDQQDVLFAAFSSSQPQTNKPSNTSAVCVYSLKDIRSKFTQNIQSCFNGHGIQGLDFITPSAPCVSVKLQINEDFCGTGVNTPLGGNDAVEAVPVTISSDRVTAMGVTATSYTVIFAGTVNGHLKKILVDGATASEYSDIVIDQGFPIKNLVFNNEYSHVYVMNEHKVVKMKVYDCSTHQSCSACLEAGDPYCGWCSSERKCSTSSECRETIDWRQRLSPNSNDTCAVIADVNPRQLQRTQSATLHLFINNFSAGSEQIYCVFKVLDRSITTLASRQSYGVECDSPPVSSLPPIPAGQHNIVAKLVVRNGYNTNLGSINYVFYDCSSYTSCTDCSSSPYPCDWCLEGNRCTHNGTQYCHNDILVGGNNSYNQSTGSCLSFQSKTDSNEILVHTGVTKAIAVKAHVTGLFVVQSKFLCEFTIEKKKFRVNAQLLGDTIYCDRFEFTFNASDPYVTAEFNILWGGGTKTMDNPDNVHIIIYRCNSEKDCGTCLIMPEKYNCGWCNRIDKCELQDNCGYPNVWFSQKRVCPNPKIHSFTPQSGPWEGGTNITIIGINLGRSISDVKGVIVAGSYCELIPPLYVKTKQVVCRLDGPGDNRLQEGHVVVRIAEYDGVSKDIYSFADPLVKSVDPKYSPLSGGNKIRIHGDHLNAGSNIKVYIGDIPCDIEETKPWIIVCKTRPLNEPKNYTLRVHFDDAIRIADNLTFEYIEDPVILSASSGILSTEKQPKGTPSGGMNIKVLGRNFRGIQFPRIRVYYNNRSASAICHGVDFDTELRCKSPKIVIDTPLDPERPLELEYGLDMADVESVRKIGTYFLYPNPVYEKFEGIYNLKPDYLTLNGYNLDWACTSEEVTVRIGGKICIITSLSRFQLTCLPPPLAKLPTGVDSYDVTVKVGRRLNFQIGKISYNQYI